MPLTVIFSAHYTTASRFALCGHVLRWSINVFLILRFTKKGPCCVGSLRFSDRTHSMKKCQFKWLCSVRQHKVWQHLTFQQLDVLLILFHQGRRAAQKTLDSSTLENVPRHKLIGVFRLVEESWKVQIVQFSCCGGRNVKENGGYMKVKDKCVALPKLLLIVIESRGKKVYSNFAFSHNSHTKY